VRVGFDSDGRRALLTQALPLPPRTEALATQYDALAVALLTALGRATGAACAPPPLVARDAEHAAARGLLAAAGTSYVVLAPGARYGPAKRWPPERFAAAGAALARAWGCTVVLVGEQSDAPATAAVRAALPAAVDLTAHRRLGRRARRRLERQRRHAHGGGARSPGRGCVRIERCALDGPARGACGRGLAPGVVLAVLRPDLSRGFRLHARRRSRPSRGGARRRGGRTRRRAGGELMP
jgi:hypothetical protein